MGIISRRFHVLCGNYRFACIWKMQMTRNSKQIRGIWLCLSRACIACIPKLPRYCQWGMNNNYPVPYSYYGHGNGQDWVDGRITGVHTYPWPTCGPQTVHTRYTIVRLIRIEIVSATLSYISRAWLEVDLSLWIPHSISLLIIVHVASIPVS